MRWSRDSRRRTLARATAGALVLLALAPAEALALTNTQDPTISAPNQREGGQLTVNPGSWSFDGLESGPLTQTWEWLRCDVPVLTCVSAQGPGGDTTYTLTAADVGSRMRVRERADCNLCSGSDFEDSAPTGVIRTDPSNDVPPVIEGTAQDGQTLGIRSGTNVWSGTDPLTFAHQWLRCDGAGANCSAIGGANGTSYKLVPDDVGATIRVQVAADSAGPTSPNPTVQSDPTGQVAPAPPVNTTPPAIGGVPREGEELGFFGGFWDGTPPLSFSYQWQRCPPNDASLCVDIAGAANRAGYTLTAADTGSRIRALVTADNAAPGSETVATAVTDVVQKVRTDVLGLMRPFPVIAIGGRLTSTGVDLNLLRVRGPRGALISVRCRGRGCPVRKLRRRIKKKRVVRIHELERRLPARTKIEVRVTARGTIGKFTRFLIRRSAAPSRRDACVQPGSTKPIGCPG